MEYKVNQIADAMGFSSNHVRNLLKKAGSKPIIKGKKRTHCYANEELPLGIKTIMEKLVYGTGSPEPEPKKKEPILDATEADLEEDLPDDDITPNEDPEFIEKCVSCGATKNLRAVAAETGDTYLMCPKCYDHCASGFIKEDETDIASAQDKTDDLAVITSEEIERTEYFALEKLRLITPKLLGAFRLIFPPNELRNILMRNYGLITE